MTSAIIALSASVETILRRVIDANSNVDIPALSDRLLAATNFNLLRDALDDIRRDTKKLARELQQGLPKRNAAERLEAISAVAFAAIEEAAP